MGNLALGITFFPPPAFFSHTIAFYLPNRLTNPNQTLHAYLLQLSAIYHSAKILENLLENIFRKRKSSIENKYKSKLDLPPLEKQSEHFIFKTPLTIKNYSEY